MEDEKEFPHRIPVQIRFNDIDMFGHLNNAIYIQFFDLGKLAYFRQYVGDDFAKGPSVPVVANINCDFLAPAYISDRLEVLTRTASIGDKSLVLEQKIVASDGSVKCTARTVMVNINTRTGQPETVSDQWRQWLLG